MDDAYRRCARLFAVSRSLALTVEQWFPRTAGRWITCHNGIDTERFTVGPRARRDGGEDRDGGGHRRRRVLFLGGMAKGKGLTVLLDALASLPAHFTVTVAGPDASPRNVEPLAAARNLARRVTAIGLVDRDAVADLFRSHDVVAVPSFRETFGLVCAEALACGTPVVATRCGGPEEVLQAPFGDLVAPGDAAGLARALERATDPCRRWDPLKANEYVVRRFSMQTIAERLEREYGAVLAKAPERA